MSFEIKYDPKSLQDYVFPTAQVKKIIGSWTKPLRGEIAGRADTH